MRVKICGITNSDDAIKAVELGAWALGFNFYKKSSRCVTVDQAKEIIQCLPKQIITIGVFVNESLSMIKNIQETLSINMIQLHGDEPLGYCQFINIPVIQVVRGHAINRKKLMSSSVKPYAFLVDAYSSLQYGGTGQCADWNMAAKLSKVYPTILAGGISAENVISAVRTVRPIALDICSGVEELPGFKSIYKMKELFSIIHREGI